MPEKESVLPDNRDKERDYNRDISQNDVFDLMMLAGKILLENGAEIFRVEETMKIIAGYYHVNGLDTFVLANGIITTMKMEGKESRTGQVMHIPLSPVHLGRVTEVNRVSREIVSGRYTIEEAMEELNRIEALPFETKKLRILFAGIGSASFCYLLGGSLLDSLVAFIAGFVLYIVMIIMQKAKTPEMLSIVFGSALVTVVSILLYTAGIGDNINNIMIGSIICLVPGVSFTTAVRNFFNSDYLSGTVRLVNALLVSISIAVGVGMVMLIWHAVV